MRYTGTPFSANPKERATGRQQASDVLRVRGSEKRPDPPRSLSYAPGRSSALVTWSAPVKNADVAGYRIYVDTEKVAYGEIKDPSIKTYEVSCTPGADAPSTKFRNVFISCVNALGFESRRVQIQVKCSPEAAGAAPPAASTPPPTSSTSAESSSSTPTSTYTGGRGGGGGIGPNTN